MLLYAFSFIFEILILFIILFKMDSPEVAFSLIWIVVACVLLIVSILLLVLTIKMLIHVYKRTPEECPNRDTYFILMIVGLFLGFAPIVAIVYYFDQYKKKK